MIVKIFFVIGFDVTTFANEFWGYLGDNCFHLLIYLVNKKFPKFFPQKYIKKISSHFFSLKNNFMSILVTSRNSLFILSKLLALFKNGQK